MSTWGALRPAETVPLAFFAPPHASSGLRCRVQRSGPRNPSLGFGEGCATRTSMGPPPQAGRLGLELDTWQDSPLRRNKALPSMTPHRSTKQETLAQRRGIGGGMVEQTRTAPAARLRAKAHSADALAAANTRTVSPWRVERCLMLKASPFDQKGEFTYTIENLTEPVAPSPAVKNG